MLTSCSFLLVSYLSDLWILSQPWSLNPIHVKCFPPLWALESLLSSKYIYLCCRIHRCANQQKSSLRWGLLVLHLLLSHLLHRELSEDLKIPRHLCLPLVSIHMELFWRHKSTSVWGTAFWILSTVTCLLFMHCSKGLKPGEKMTCSSHLLWYYTFSVTLISSSLILHIHSLRAIIYMLVTCSSLYEHLEFVLAVLYSNSLSIYWSMSYWLYRWFGKNIGYKVDYCKTYHTVKSCRRQGSQYLIMSFYMLIILAFCCVLMVELLPDKVLVSCSFNLCDFTCAFDWQEQETYSMQFLTWSWYIS